MAMGSAARRKACRLRSRIEKSWQGRNCRKICGHEILAAQRGKTCRAARQAREDASAKKEPRPKISFQLIHRAFRRKSFQQGHSQLSARRFRIEVHGPAAVCSSSCPHGFQSARWRLRNRRTAGRSLAPENAGGGHHRSRQSVCRREFLQRSQQARRQAHHRL